MSVLDAWVATRSAPAWPQGPFDLIMADPPWLFAVRSAKGITRKGAAGQYACMSLDDIRALPVAELAARDCVLLLWATNPLLDVAFTVLSAWGFTFKTAAHWVKRTTNGHLAFGTGYVLRSAGEPILVGTRGRPRTSRSVRSVFEGRVTGHSRKPDEAYAWAESLLPGARRLELFSRRSRAGWVTYGDEAGKFDEKDVT